MLDKEIIIEVARISPIKISKDVRADNPYQGYDTFFVIMDVVGNIYQYYTSNSVSRVLSNGSEIMTVLRSGDKIKVTIMPKKSNQDIVEANRIAKIISFTPKM